MIGAKDYAMKQEQYQDLVREAERERLVKLAAGGCQETGFGYMIENLVSGLAKRRSSGGQVPCDQRSHLLEKAA